MAGMGQVLLLMGLALIGGGLLFLFMPDFQLPGDFSFSAGNFHFYLPLATSLILSVALTFSLNLVTGVLHPRNSRRKAS